MEKVITTSASCADSIDMYLAQRLKKFRLRVGWTLAELAEHVGVSHQQIHKYEQGQSKISAGMLYKLSTIFSTSPGSFFEGYNPKKHGTGMQSDNISLKVRQEINLLLIEDSASDEFMLRKILESFPYKFVIYCLHNGKDALDYLKGRISDAPILLEINLSKISGISILRSIKQDRNIQGIPVLVLTNSLNKQDMMSAYKNFANGYISKPFDGDAFKKKLRATFTYWIDTVILPDSWD